MSTSSGLLEYLLGRWAVARTVTDIDLQRSGRFTGTAAFTPDNGNPATPGAAINARNSPVTAEGNRALSHHETGTLAWADQAGTRAERTLLWRPGNAPWAMEVFFADGRPFHSLDLTPDNDRSGSNLTDVDHHASDRPVHSCAPDTYRGAFAILDNDAWSYTWRVTGPHKNLLLETVLTRIR